MIRACRDCDIEYNTFSTLQTRCPKCQYARQKPPKRYEFKQRKPIKQRGKEYKRWELFREKIAIPYLDKKYGHVCSCCGVGGALDVDHIQNKGSHFDLKYDLSNLQFLCRFPCHYKKTAGHDCRHL